MDFIYGGYMKFIEKTDIEIMNLLNYGSFSDVYRAFYCESMYCYKKLLNSYPKDIMINIAKLTEKKLSDEFLIPKFIIGKNEENFEGYLSPYNPDLIEINDVFSRKRKILMLKKAKLAIEKLHSIYNIIHGDINIGNILFDDELEKAYLIDFDSCLEINQTLGSTISFSKETIEYLKHNKLDYRLDIYNFNLATLMSLSNKNVVEILEKINEGTSLLIEENKDIKRLSRELILDDRKTYSGEYIVDYL